MNCISDFHLLTGEGKRKKGKEKQYPRHPSWVINGDCSRQNPPQKRFQTRPPKREGKRGGGGGVMGISFLGDWRLICFSFLAKKEKKEGGDPLHYGLAHT